MFLLSLLQSLPLLLTVVILSMHSFVHPYKSRVANYSESLVMLVLVIILALGNTTVLVEATTDVKKFTLAPLLFLPILVGGIITTVYTLGTKYGMLHATIVKMFYQMGKGAFTDSFWSTQTIQCRHHGPYPPPPPPPLPRQNDAKYDRNTDTHAILPISSVHACTVFTHVQLHFNYITVNIVANLQTMSN